jgi:hypothetical protein
MQRCAIGDGGRGCVTEPITDPRAEHPAEQIPEPLAQRIAETMPTRANPLGEPPGKDDANTGAYRRLFANSNFRKLWYGQFVSGIGDWLVIGFLMPLVTKMSGG